MLLHHKSSRYMPLKKWYPPTRLSSPRRYSSGWVLSSWPISLLSSLFFTCSDDETSNGRAKKWEECGWKRSWPTYFCALIFLHEADYLVSKQFSVYGVRLLASRPTPNLEDQNIPLLLATTAWPVRHGWPYHYLRYRRHSSQGLGSTQTPPPR
jgi:hypothetical protein